MNFDEAPIICANCLQTLRPGKKLTLGAEWIVAGFMICDYCNRTFEEITMPKDEWVKKMEEKLNG